MPATAATRAPSGAVSVPLPRTPRENMRSKTGRGADEVELAVEVVAAEAAAAIEWTERRRQG